ncbi:hypothetical protein Tco_0089554 [Tanacetum coccineum]
MTTLADKAILSGADNCPPMLEKDMYDSWKSIMELYMMNRQHGRMILESVENGPLIWPTIEENGVTRPRKYSELTPADAIQADCDVKATNIILQGLPPEVYALVSNHRIAKELWERIQLLMQGTSLTKQERECKLYDEFDKFAYKKGETLRDFYLRFSLLLNDMNIYNVKLEQFQVNTKFLNTLPPEWSKFVTDVKLVRDLHTTNIDQIHTYLGQHEFHANEVRLMHERNSDPLPLVATHQMTQIIETIHVDFDELTAMASEHSSSGPALHEMTPATISSGLVPNPPPSTPFVPPSRTNWDILFQSLFDELLNPPSSVDCPAPEVIALIAEVVAPEPAASTGSPSSTTIDQDAPSPNALVKVNNQDNMDNNMINQVVQAMPSSEQSSVVNHLETEITVIAISFLILKKESLMQTVTLLKNDFKKKESRNIDRDIALEKEIKPLDNIIFKRDQYAQTKAQQLEPKLYDGNVIKNTSAIVIPNSEETLMLDEESQFYKILQILVFCRPTKVEVPKELPKVSMVNMSLKKLKHHLAGFDVVVKERFTAIAITEGSWGFEHTKACFRDEIILFVRALKDLFNTFDHYLIDGLSKVQNVFHQIEQDVEQHRLKSKTFEVKMNKVLNENERLLEQVISKDIVNIIMNSSVDNAYVNVHECEKCLKLETELLNKMDFIEKETYDKLITTTVEVPLRKPTALESDTPKPVVTLVYSRKPKKSKTNVPVSKPKIIKSISANKKELSKSWGSIVFDVPSSSLDECMSSKLFSDMMASSPIRLYFKGLKRLSMVLARRLYILNFGAINHLARHGLVRGLSKLKIEKDHLCSACAIAVNGRSTSSFIVDDYLDFTGSSSRTRCINWFTFLNTVDQDAPSPSSNYKQHRNQISVIPNNVEEDNHDLDAAHMNNDPFFGIPIPKNNSEASSSSDVIPTVVHTATPNSEHVTYMDHKDLSF